MTLSIRQAYEVTQYLSPHVQRRLNAFLGRVRAGTATDFRTKVWADESRSDILNDVLSFTVPSGFTMFDEVEEAATKKFGSFSVRLPYDEERDRLEQYFKPKHFNVESAVLDRAIHKLKGWIPGGSLRSSDVVTAYENSPKGTNWGLPYFSSSKIDYPKYLDLCRDLERKGYPFGDYWPCVLGVRSQPNGIGDPAKWRPLHMASHVVTITELRLLRPLLTKLKRHPWMVAWNTPTDINIRATEILRRDGMKLSSDFTSYDASLCSELIRGAFDCIRFWFQNKDGPLVNWVEDVFLHVGILTPDGLYVGRDGGVPSGLTFTNMIDTLAQILVDFMVAELLDTQLVDAMYLGDDGVKLFLDGVTPDEYAQMTAMMGLVSSPSKSLYSEGEIDFLQRRHSRRYIVNGIFVGYRSQVRTANGVISYETYRDLSGYELAIRAVQQVEQCSDNERFRDMVKWLYDGDDFLRNMAATDILRKAGGVDKVEEVLKTRSYPYNQRDLSELENFETVRILNELRGQGLTSPSRTLLLVE